MAQRLDVQYVRFYTDGSAARKIAPVEPLKTVKLPKIKKRKKVEIHVDPMSVGAIAMAVVMFVLMMVGTMRLQQAKQEAVAMESYVQTLEQKNAELAMSFDQSYDIEQIEKTALALGLVPQEQVKHVTLQVPVIVEEEQPDAWERFYIFLTGLFA